MEQLVIICAKKQNKKVRLPKNLNAENVARYTQTCSPNLIDDIDDFIESFCYTANTDDLVIAIGDALPDIQYIIEELVEEINSESNDYVLLLRKTSIYTAYLMLIALAVLEHYCDISVLACELRGIDSL